MIIIFYVGDYIKMVKPTISYSYKVFGVCGGADDLSENSELHTLCYLKLPILYFTNSFWFISTFLVTPSAFSQFKDILTIKGSKLLVSSAILIQIVIQS